MAGVHPQRYDVRSRKQSEYFAMKLPQFEYSCPDKLADAIALLAAHGSEAKALAGGQSLVPMLAFRVASPSLIVDLRKLDELRRIDISEAGITLGAMVRWREILENAELGVAHPLLVAAIGHVAHYQIRNRGTVGGSLAHADPAAELPCIAVTCEVEIGVIGAGGERTIAAADFFHGPLMTSLGADELIRDIRLPPWPAQRRFGFAEFARRSGDFALAGAAVFYDMDLDGNIRNAHVGVIGGADRPLRLKSAEDALNGREAAATIIAAAAAAGAAAADPPGDIHASSAYRRVLVGTMIERALRSAAALD
jgi:aerobic carbon-monoxide dehydrogenase medium subunit